MVKTKNPSNSVRDARTQARTDARTGKKCLRATAKVRMTEAQNDRTSRRRSEIS